jgi:putative flippase GtrA
MFRYTMVSVISAVLSFSILGIVFGVFQLWTEVPSTIFANVVTLIPNYYLNRNWVWGKSGRSHWLREVVPFWALSFGGILLSIVSAALAHHVSVKNHLSHLEATALLLSVILASFGVLWVFKFIVFNRLFTVATPDPSLGLSGPPAEPERSALF